MGMEGRQVDAGGLWSAGCGCGAIAFPRKRHVNEPPAGIGFVHIERSGSLLFFYQGK